ncbi:MAG: HAMP domain-containing histidine kinase [Hyphomonadaceae bacterium]|nr:HAMP domain-containing histidine kinase [Hyphomonadaceae bacterium]
MRPSLALLRTTTFRLALAQAGLVLSLVLALLAYVYFATVGELRRASDALADQEYALLERAYAEGGIRRLDQEVVERAASDSPFLYVLAENNGAVIAGDFQQLPVLPDNASDRVDFNFERAEGDDVTRGRARGRIGRLLNGPILLVARDLNDAAGISGRITRVLWTIAVFGIIISIAAGLIGAWFAARRVEALANTARDVMAGDMRRRAPVRGEGDEYDSLAESLNAMLDRLERLMHISRTAGDAIAHDLRSPLTRFRYKLEAALDTPPDTQADREALRKALEEADGLLDTFAAILKLARVEANASWRFERFDASAILQELIEFYEPAAEEQGRTLSGAVEPNLVIRGEPGLFTQAVSNLIENALKYTHAGGRVEVLASRRADGLIEVRVMDDGPGIAPADRDRAVERFVRLETARSTPGAGLGLSLVAAVARLHKGGLHLRDGLGDGEHRGLGAALVLPADATPAAAH